MNEGQGQDKLKHLFFDFAILLLRSLKEVVSSNCGGIGGVRPAHVSTRSASKIGYAFIISF